MSQSNWDDLYERLTSRKLWLCLIAIAFATWGYRMGELNAVQFQQAVMAAVITFSASEGLVDAVAAYRPKPASGDAQTVNVGTEPLAVAAAPTIAPAATTRPKRPSRAKPAPAVLTEPVVAVPAPRRPRPRPATDLERTP